MKNYIIGIAGKKNSGKDIVANMINYIFATGITKVSYADYLIKKVSINNTYKERIIHFADGLKDVLSIIYNIPREYFDDRNKKDNMYYNIKSGKFYKEDVVKNKPYVEIITIDRLKNFTINDVLRCAEDKLVYIKLRTLMQYFGTNICRNKLDNDIWIRQTISKAINIAETRKLCLIPDVRFDNEVKAIKNNNVSLYGGLVMIERDKDDNSNESKHSSEDMNINADFNINNNGSLMSLFYKVLEICQKIL